MVLVVGPIGYLLAGFQPVGSLEGVEKDVLDLIEGMEGVVKEYA